MPYPMLSPTLNNTPGDPRDLAEGKIDAAIVWGPIAGYYAKRVRSAGLP
jgi:hypothetical protein